MIRLTTTILAAFLLAPMALSAQEAPPQPGVIVVSEQKCDFSTLGDLNDYFRANAAPILDELVAEGRLIGWGVLGHLWGDEWNNIVYYSATDLATFHGAFNEYFERLLQHDPNAMQTLAQHCTEHRDNIYSVVMTSASTGS